MRKFRAIYSIEYSYLFLFLENNNFSKKRSTFIIILAKLFHRCNRIQVGLIWQIIIIIIIIKLLIIIILKNINNNNNNNTINRVVC